jgi:hypothetical protein
LIAQEKVHRRDSTEYRWDYTGPRGQKALDRINRIERLRQVK